MKFFKFNRNDSLKTKILYAFGEISMLVVGILLAVFLNNYNAAFQYEKRIDKNLIRVYDELEENIEVVRQQIEKLQRKDSIIHLVMNDSLTTESYKNNLELAYLIIYYHSFDVQDEAYHNLIQLNTTDNDYKEEFISGLKELYSLSVSSEDADTRIASFVYEESIPLLAKNVESFGDLTYKGVIGEDAIDFFVNSNEYKSFVSQYSIFAIKNQLRYYGLFYKRALKIHDTISEQYDLEDGVNLAFDEDLYAKYEGNYINTLYRDTIAIQAENDSVFLSSKRRGQINLVPISRNRFFINSESGGYFVSLLHPNDSSDDLNLKMHILSNRIVYQKLNKK